MDRVSAPEGRGQVTTTPEYGAVIDLLPKLTDEELEHLWQACAMLLEWRDAFVPPAEKA